MSIEAGNFLKGSGAIIGSLGTVDSCIRTDVGTNLDQVGRSLLYPDSRSADLDLRTRFWADPKREIAGTLMTQVFPCFHLTLKGDFQQQIYDALNTAPSTSSDY